MRLSDEDSINDINPFVMHDFSLPGGVRQNDNFDSFSKTPASSGGIMGADESVYCGYALCETVNGPSGAFTVIHPRRNIDPGFTCDSSKRVKVGVSNETRVPYVGIMILVTSMALVLVYLRRR